MIMQKPLLKLVSLSVFILLSATAGSQAFAQANPQSVPVPTPQTPTSAAPKAAAAPTPAPAPVVPFTGSTLERIKNTGTILIGNRSGSIPISFTDSSKRPMGYGIEICTRVAQRIRERLGMPTINIQYVEVDSSNRVPYTVSGKVDIECGSTTNNADRRKQVDFSIPYYISGVRILTRSDTGINSLADLKNKTAVFGKGTTSVKIIDQFNKERDMKIKITEAPDFDAATADVINKKADAFILDDLLLYGARSKVPSPAQDNLVVVGDFLSIEPLAIMMRKNDKIKAIVDKELYELMRTGEINNIYSKWFERPIPPNNKSLNIPQSGLLKDVFRMPTDVVGN